MGQSCPDSLLISLGESSPPIPFSMSWILKNFFMAAGNSSDFHDITSKNVLQRGSTEHILA